MLTTDIDPDTWPIPNIHPAHDPELKLWFFRCVIGYLEQAVGPRQAEAQRQQEEDAHG